MEDLTAMKELVQTVFGQTESEGPPVTDQALSVFEAQIGYELPPEYRLFLKALNGCHASPLGLCCPLIGHPYQAYVDFHMVFGLNTRTEAFDLLSVNSYEPPLVDFPQPIRPKGLLAIAIDSLNDEICIHVDPGVSRYGSVVFFDWLDSEMGREQEYVFRIADSFVDFLKGLHRCPED